MNIIRIILFVLVNVAGFYANSVIANLAVKFDFFPALAPGSALAETFKFWYMGIGLWAWIASVLVSVGYFFAQDKIKNWLLLAPMYVTAIYCVSVLVYFNYFYTLG